MQRLENSPPSPAENWERFYADYRQLLDVNYVSYVHGTELLHGKGQYKGWRPEKINALVLSIRSLINKHLAFAFVSVIRRNDYDEIYKSGEQPKKLPRDSKIGVLFRASLAFLPEAVIRENKEEARQAQINVALESGGPTFERLSLFFHGQLFELFASGIKRFLVDKGKCDADTNLCRVIVKLNVTLDFQICAQGCDLWRKIDPTSFTLKITKHVHARWHAGDDEMASFVYTEA